VTGNTVDRCQAEVINDQHLDDAEAAQQSSIATVTASQHEFGKQLWDAAVEYGMVVATGLMAEGTS
jgi:hypothetical protein